MQHDTTTAPTTASTIASSPSARIDALEGKLAALPIHTARRTARAGPGLELVHAPRANSVFPLGGRDTCRACIAEPTANRTGRQP